VVSVGEKVTEDIQVGDKVLWDITKGRGNAYGGFDIVHQDNILAVERENS
jgi:co-chaperonin GroES (HSP10)